MITLYDYWRSSASYRVRIALNILDLRYVSVPVDLVKGEQFAAANTARNPQGLVPWLEIDGLCLTQSVAILEYLDETRGGLMPRTPEARARVRALAYAIAMEIAPVCNLSVRNHVASLSGGAITAEGWQHHHISRGLAAFEAMLHHPAEAVAPGTCCHGDDVSIADLCLVPQVYNAERLQIDIAAYPRIARIVASLRALPAFVAAHPDHAKP